MSQNRTVFFWFIWTSNKNGDCRTDATEFDIQAHFRNHTEGVLPRSDSYESDLFTSRTASYLLYHTHEWRSTESLDNIVDRQIEWVFSALLQKQQTYHQGRKNIKLILIRNRYLSLFSLHSGPACKSFNLKVTGIKNYITSNPPCWIITGYYLCYSNALTEVKHIESSKLLSY